MNPTLRHHSNALQFAALMRWIVIAVFLGIAGLSYVYLKNQQHLSGTTRQRLEQELEALKAQNNDLDSRIALLASSYELQKKIDAGIIKLTPIISQAVVHLRAADAQTQSGFETVENAGLRPVSGRARR